MHKKANALIHETSPYLLQHAYNPVEWMPWGEEALARALAEDKPILVSIGYSACHWCHVMERESFEDEGTAEIMNRHFVNIKVDREERPDIDHIYMEAVQAMTGSGGWPLNVFLTPSKMPFYGGTYYPPVRAYNRMSWRETLYAVAEAYKQRREEIEKQAYNLTEHLQASNTFGLSKPGEEAFFTDENTNLAAENLLAAADRQWGGFGRAPKFPQTFSIQYLLQHYYYTKHQPSLDQALLSLDKMINGGIYDHLGGGFARYSTDEKWLAPHFEKMLYDNALLIGVLAEACQLTQNARYVEVIKETVDFIEREMTSPEGGFYSALDADSEGVEGKYYTWSKQEVDEILLDESPLFCDIYNIISEGNWEHTNIPWLPVSLEEKAGQHTINREQLTKVLAKSKNKLFLQRQNRIRPGLDDKILLGWNALMITALCKAGKATGNERYINLASGNLLFLEKHLIGEDGQWFHCWKKNQPKHPAFLEDFAYLGQAYIQMQQATGSNAYLEKAKKLTVFTLERFTDEEEIFFYFTGVHQQDVLIRKKEVYDGATPSGNAIMATNLYYLSLVFDNAQWKERAEKMISALGKTIVRYPSSFGIWACLVEQVSKGWKEIAVVGEEANSFLQTINRSFLPGKVIQISQSGEEAWPLLKDKNGRNGETLAYLCENYQCSAPVNSPEILLKNALISHLKI